MDLRPDSSAYASQCRLISSHLVQRANDTVGSAAVRAIRVLPPGAPSRAARVSPAPDASDVLAFETEWTREKTGQNVPLGCLQAREVAQAARAMSEREPSLASSEYAIESPLARPEGCFTAAPATLDDLLWAAAAAAAGDVRVRALRRALAERGDRLVTNPKPDPDLSPGAANEAWRTIWRRPTAHGTVLDEATVDENRNAERMRSGPVPARTPRRRGRTPRSECGWCGALGR